MQKTYFKNVALDTYTYSQLELLAKSAKLTKVECLRRLIREKLNEVGQSPDGGKVELGGTVFNMPGFSVPVAQFVVSDELQKKAAQSGVELVFKSGEVLRFTDLNLAQKLAHRLYQKRGKTLDSRKFLKTLSEILESYGETAKEPGT